MTAMHSDVTIPQQGKTADVVWLAPGINPVIETRHENNAASVQDASAG